MKNRQHSIRRAWRYSRRLLRLVDRKAFALYRGGGLVIGIGYWYHLVAVPVAALSRAFRRRAVRLDRRAPHSSVDFSRT